MPRGLKIRHGALGSVSGPDMAEERVSEVRRDLKWHESSMKAPGGTSTTGHPKISQTCSCRT